MKVFARVEHTEVAWPHREENERKLGSNGALEAIVSMPCGLQRLHAIWVGQNRIYTPYIW